MTAVGKLFAMVPIEAISDSTLTPSEFKVLVTLYSFRNNNYDTTFPKLASLAARAGFKDPTQISKITTRLESKGWLTKNQKMGFHGPKIYNLTIPDRLICAPKTADKIPKLEETPKLEESSKSYPQTPAETPKLEETTKLEETAITNLEEITNSQVGRNYQVYKNRSVRTDHNNKSVFPDPCGSAAGAALTQYKNLNLNDLAAIYSNPDATTEVFNHGVPLLTRSGVEFGQARNFLQSLMTKRGVGRTLDAVIVALIEQPDEPKPYIQAVLSKLGDEIPKDWTPPAPAIAELATLGIPEKIIEESRDVFLVWFREMGIRHNNFAGLFVRWCRQDWERAQENVAAYKRVLAASGGLGEVFREPA